MTDFAQDDAVIVAYARTPIGRARKGSLVDVRPEDLALTATEAALAQVPGLPIGEVEDLMLGCAENYGEQGFNLARRIAVLLGEDHLPGTTVNRFCASSLQATRMAFHAIRAGEGAAYLVVGVESVTRVQQAQDEWEAPQFALSHDEVRRQLVETLEWSDPRERGLLPDYYMGMGITAEFVARHTGTTREDQDAWALLSQQRAGAAQDSGFFTGEIAPVTSPDGSVVDRDDSPRPGTTAEALAGLSPVFHPEGTVTAGNACPMNDGASALLVVSGEAARHHGLTPLARIVATGVSGLSPEIMGLGPVEASRMALGRAGLTAADLDLVELNEAFAAQVVPSARQLGIDPEILNVHGGAIALGHPYGATGARLIGTLARGLAERDGRFGLATLCVGGGQGMALVLERVS